jgi:hypothetical protein
VVTAKVHAHKIPAALPVLALPEASERGGKAKRRPADKLGVSVCGGHMSFDWHKGTGEGQACAQNRAQWNSHGRLAQLGERLPYKEDVGGSSPSSPTISSISLLQRQWRHGFPSDLLSDRGRAIVGRVAARTLA